MVSSKSPRVGKGPVVRQMRGPGMNLGLKKPRHGYIKKPKEYTPSKELRGNTMVDTGSYLPADKPEGGKRPRAGSSKVIKSTTF
jgi:hypothetical protein